MLHDILFLLMGIGLLTLGGNYVTDGAVAIAKKFNVSTMMIGLTVVALGSSMPDLVVCVTSTLTGKSQMALGDVVGANIFDVLLVFGIMALIRPLKVSNELLYQDLPMLALSSLAIFFCGDDKLFDGGSADLVNRTDGLMLLSLFVIFMCYNVSNAKREKLTLLSAHSCTASVPIAQKSAAPSVKSTESDASSAQKAPKKGLIYRLKLGRINEKKVHGDKPLKPWVSWVYVIGGLAALVVGGNWVVSGASGIALKAGLSQAMVGLTVVAFGSASPDLASSLVALFKGKADLAIGNIVGSCVLNVFGLLGLCATIHPLESGTITLADFSTLAGASLLVWFMAFLSKSHTLTRFAGVILVLGYCGYLTYLVLNAVH